MQSEKQIAAAQGVLGRGGVYVGAELVKAALEAALSAAEPWPFEHQNYNCPCIHPSQCDESCVKKTAPAVAVKAGPVEWQLVFEDGNVSRAVYTKKEADDYERRSASVISVRPLYAATTQQPIYESALRLEFEKLLDACIREFGWTPDANPDEPVGNDSECEITWGDLHRAHTALSAQVQDVAAPGFVPWGQVERTNDGDLAIYGATYHVRLANFTTGADSGLNVGDIFYRAAPASQEGGHD